MKDQGYGKNGSEELLRLKAYNPTLDTPIELLHTVPLGIGKALLQFFWKDVLTKDQQPLLPGCAFEGASCLSLSDILSLVLQKSLMDLSAKCFDSLGCLSSLLYMRNVEGSLLQYINLVRHFTTELTDNLLLLDNRYVELKKEQATVLSLLPKVHMLHHLAEDIVRFGLPVHYETEHGEQFNKFIHEEILRTIATTLRRTNKESHGSRLRNSTIEKKKNLLYRSRLGHRENADNNDYAEQARNTLQKGTTGYFNCSAPGQTIVVEKPFTSADEERTLLNVHKYGTLWFMHRMHSPVQSYRFNSLQGLCKRCMTFDFMERKKVPNLQTIVFSSQSR
ncbi:hypothetical protein EDC96DRAFT_570099 [Choanephora cucurbitarum]|nr:hypothetical protein EDC96DRAFT_570099 [Choanephora cucurbitarum]